MLIRELVVADAESYLELRLESERELPQYVGLQAEREMAEGLSGVRALLANYAANGTVVWGGFEDDRLLGVLGLSRQLSPKYRHKPLLWGMYVLPKSRGGGVAPALVQAAIAWASQQAEIVAISLQVGLRNTRGQNFYKRFGFVTFGTEQRAIFAAGQFHGVHYMELEIRP